MKTRWIAFCTALFAAACCQSAELYRVSGIVVNAQTGAPWPRARLAVLRTPGTSVEARQVAGADGGFSFDLPQGIYNLVSGTSDDPQVYGRKTSDMLLGSSIIVAPGQDTSHLVFRWFPTGAISGRVVDEAGEPVEGALVQLVRSAMAAGRRLTATMGWARTDDRGEYRFGRLPGSVYYLAVTGKPWYAGRSEVIDHGSQPVAYAAVYYPNSAEPAGAAPLALRPGEELRSDFTMRTIPGSAVNVEVESPHEITGSVAIVRDGIGSSDNFLRQERLTGGSQRLEAVPAGRYQVRVTGTSGNTPVTGRSTIDVTGSDLDVKVMVKPNSVVSGTVRFKNPGVKPQGSVLVSLMEQDSGRSIATAVRPDGSFLFPSAAPEKYWIAIRGTDGYFASEIHVDGAAFSSGVVDLQEGETVTIRLVASDETGRVRGFVMSGDRIVEGALVVLAPAAGSADWSAYAGFQTDHDGSYDFQNVRSGDYLLFAVEDIGLEYTNPKVLRPFLPSAKAVHVEPHGSYSERIPLVHLAPEH